MDIAEVAKLTGMPVDLKEAVIQDLDSAMRDAAREPAGAPSSSRSAADRFDALFSASPSGETSDKRDENAAKPGE